MEMIFEIFVALSEHDKLRQLLGNNLKVIAVINSCFSVLMKEVKREHEALASLFSFSSNLVLDCSRIIKMVTQQYDFYEENLSAILKLKNARYLSLHEAIYSFISNSLTDKTIRAKV